MKLTWLGHAGFRMEWGDQVLLIDPWFTGNPMFEGQDRDAAIAGTTAILVSHGHGDHAGEAIGLSKSQSAPIVGIYDLMTLWADTEGVETIGFNKGGTVMLGNLAVTMVHATHSSAIAGTEAGFMIAHAGRTAYFSGDTDVMADMGVFQALHKPEIGILAAGGHFTMDMKRAAYAAQTFFDFKTVIPCHYRTFPLLEQSAQTLIDALPGVTVREPEVMVPIDL